MEHPRRALEYATFLERLAAMERMAHCSTLDLGLGTLSLDSGASRARHPDGCDREPCLEGEDRAPIPELREDACVARRRVTTAAVLLSPTLLVVGCGGRSSIDDWGGQGVAWSGEAGGAGDAAWAVAVGGNPGGGAASMFGSGSAAVAAGGAWGAGIGGAPVGIGGASALGSGGATDGAWGVSTLGSGGAGLGGAGSLTTPTGGAPAGGSSGTVFATGGRSDASGGSSALSGTGGSGAEPDSGGEPCGPLIDDMEDGSGVVCSASDRVGVWYACNDGGGTQYPAPNQAGVPILPELLPEPRGASRYAMHSTGTGFVGWGVAIGVDLAFDGQVYGLYDASAYGGIRFWARSDTSTPLRVRISTASTTLDIYGGRCEREPCGPASVQVSLTPTWTEYLLRFVDFGAYSLDDFGEVTNIQFFFSTNGDFDVWVDDLAFMIERPNCCSDLPQCQGGIAYADPDLLAQLPREAQTCEGACFLDSLSVTGSEVDSLSGIECLGAVSSVTLDGTGASDLSPLGEVPNLTSLSVSNQPIDTLKPLAALGALSQLMLVSTAVGDWSSLNELSSLAYLTASGFDVAALDISGLPALSNLTLGSARIADLILTELPALSYVDLNGIISDRILVTGSERAGSVDVDGSTLGELVVRDLPGLYNVWISSTTMDRLTLESLPRLSQLTVTDSAFRELGVHDTPSLSSVTFSADGLSAPPPLSGLPPLSTLNLDNNAFTVLDASALPVSSYLSLLGNQLTDVTVANLETLQALNVADNLLSSLRLSNLPALTYLNASGNALTTLQFDGLGALGTVYFERCAMQDLSGLASLTGLVEVHASLNQISDPTPLAALPVLQRLYLGQNAIAHLEPFLSFAGFASSSSLPGGSWILDVQTNPFSCTDEASTIEALEAQGVSVWASCPE